MIYNIRCLHVHAHRVCVDYAKEKGVPGPVVNIKDFIVFTATDCMGARKLTFL